MNLTVLKSTGQVFCRISPNWGCLLFSSRVIGLGEEHQTGNTPSSAHHHIRINDVNTTYEGDVNLDNQVKAVLARSLPRKLLCFPLHTVFFGSESLCPTHIQEKKKI